MVDEFLLTRDGLRKRRLGHMLLHGKIITATDELRDAKARKRGRLHPLVPDVHLLVKYKLGSIEEREALFPQLETQLSLAA